MRIHLQTLFVGFDRIALRWGTSDPVPAPVHFEVLRSGNALTGFEVVARTDGIAMIDRVDLMGKFKPVFYKVRAAIAGAVVESDVAGIQSAPNADTIRLQKRERYQLARNEGVPAFLYTRRRSGPRCPVCTASNKAMGNMGIECARCFGTGYDGGYYPPMPLYVANQAMAQEGADLTPEFVKENNSANLWTSNWSIINPEDAIWELTPPNYTWHVTGVQRSQRRRAGLRQLLTVNEADRGGNLSRLPVPDFAFPDPLDIFMFDFSIPSRDFDTIFQEALDAYTKTYQDVPQPDDPALGPVGPAKTGGGRNPAKGYSR